MQFLILDSLPSQKSVNNDSIASTMVVRSFDSVWASAWVTLFIMGSVTFEDCKGSCWLSTVGLDFVSSAGASSFSHSTAGSSTFSSSLSPPSSHSQASTKSSSSPFESLSCFEEPGHGNGMNNIEWYQDGLT